MPRGASTRSVRRRSYGFALALPSGVWYSVLFIAPLLIILWYSFGYKPSLDRLDAPIALDRLSFASYRDSVSPAFAALFLSTLRIAAIGTLLCLVVGFPVAYVISTRVPSRWKGPVLALLILPFWTSFLLRTFAWRILLSSGGPLSVVLIALGFRSEPIHVLDTAAAVQIGVVYNYLPLMILPLFVALDRIDPSLREASKDLGASPLATFGRVTLPLAMPGVVAGVLLVFIPLAGEYVTPTILGGARGAMAGSLIASQFLEAQNWALGSAQAVVLVLLILAVVGAVAIGMLIARLSLRIRSRAETADAL